jgi:putative FmdB family regulatory protein
MPTYEFLCNQCKHEWEDFLSIKAPDPTECPECKANNNITRLISGGSGKGKVVLTGHELIAKTKEDTNKLRERLKTDEKFHANVVGEGKFNKMVK